MYGRDYQGRELHFEPSGGLLYSALVMQDKETDSYWSIMTGDALAGDLRGEALQELPLGEKVQWGKWRRRHPDTLVLSVDGREHIENNPYDNYVSSDSIFRGAEARDVRFRGKQPIFSFRLNGKPYAVPFEDFAGGATFRVGGIQIFLYRPKDAAVFYSTAAYRTTGKGFGKKGKRWRELDSGSFFDPQRSRFEPAGAVEPLFGFDTFWYMWSETHPDTQVLGRRGKR